MARKTTQPKPLNERVTALREKEQKMYADAGIARSYVILFGGNRQKPPMLGRLGAKLIAWSGGFIDVKYFDKG